MDFRAAKGLLLWQSRLILEGVAFFEARNTHEKGRESASTDLRYGDFSRGFTFCAGQQMASSEHMPYREGFALAGAWLIEHERVVAQYPRESQSTRIWEERQRVGGEAFGLACHWRSHATDLPLYAIGSVGEDDDGHTVLSACHQLEVDTYQLHAHAAAATAHAEIMVSGENASHTCFYLAGANDALGLAQFDFRHCLARWFHLGDLHLLAQLSRRDEEFGTMAGAVLHRARAAGLITSLSLTAPAEGFDAEARARTFSQTDYLILSQETLAAITGMISDHHTTSRRQLWEAAAQEILAQSANSGVVVHAAEACWYVLCNGDNLWRECAAQTMTPNPAPESHSRERTAWVADFLYRRYCDLAHAPVEKM